ERTPRRSGIFEDAALHIGTKGVTILGQSYKVGSIVSTVWMDKEGAPDQANIWFGKVEAILRHFNDGYPNYIAIVRYFAANDNQNYQVRNRRRVRKYPQGVNYWKKAQMPLDVDSVVPLTRLHGLGTVYEEDGANQIIVEMPRRMVLH